MNNKDYIKQFIAADRTGDLTFSENLDHRKIEEIEFHDKDRSIKNDLTKAQENQDKKVQTSNSKYYKTNNRLNEYLDRWYVDNMQDKIVLDFACGEGKNTFKAIDCGAKFVLGIDISPIAIELSKKKSVQKKIKNVLFIQADCEDTRLPDDSFKVIICSGMLHHLDFNHALPELERILASGGVIICIEALAYNPIINLYRKLTPEKRTAWEARHILDDNSLKQAADYFSVRNINYWNLFETFNAFFPMLKCITPKLDQLFCRIPGIRKLSWIFTFELCSKK